MAPPMVLRPPLDSYDQLIVDLDGTVYVGERLTPGAAEAIDRLRAAGKKVAFVTNNPRMSGEDYVRKLWKLGIKASLGDVVTVGGATQHLLAETRQGRTAFVIGSPAMHQHVRDAGLRLMNGTDLASRVEVVVVAGTDRVDYDDLRTATLAVRRGADFLATSRDPTYPMPDGMWPGTGAILAAVETAAEQQAALIGKPEPQLMLTAIERMGEGRTLVIGDRPDTDGAAAAAAKLDFALVLTGGADRAAAEKLEQGRPVAIAENLAALVGPS
ncbi:MAG: glycerol-phosphatase [Thermoleophilaceae bacterium]|nr:glycerol-phosphatase [Thermoleophilaceae bacterium]